MVVHIKILIKTWLIIIILKKKHLKNMHNLCKKNLQIIIQIIGVQLTRSININCPNWQVTNKVFYFQPQFLRF